ncbi:TPM domain-containing protein [Candidatus Collierbacteria bacterium]|nr:TPM domain-containing protein [Candidatus Collierbacteria bacterium]
MNWSRRFGGLVLAVIASLLIFPYANLSGSIWKVVTASPAPQYTSQDKPLANEPDYPVPVDKVIPYWITNCQVSQDTIMKVDKILEDLNADHIAQTVLVCMKYGEVHDPTSYAIRFLRYMGLGLTDGPRKDNGMVLLALTDKTHFELHYGVGLGLSAITAPNMGDIIRATGDGFNGNLDDAVVQTATMFSQAARIKYQPNDPVTPKYGQPIEQNSGSLALILIVGGVIAFCWLILLTEAPLGFLIMLSGSETLVSLTLWPFKLILFVLEIMASSSSSSRDSSSSSSSSGSSGRGGRSGGGSGGSSRGR